MADLKKGDKAPGFSLPGTFDKIVNLEDFQGKKLLIYFFPKAGTPG